MDVTFANLKLKKIYEDGKETGKQKYPAGIVKTFILRIEYIKSVKDTTALRKIYSFRYESLKRNLIGFDSIRVNDQYRIILKVINAEAIEIIEIHDLTDYH